VASIPPRIEASWSEVERAFAGAGLQALEEIKAEAEQIAHWTGVPPDEVVKALSCLEMWSIAGPRCADCGCMDDNACEGGCEWTDSSERGSMVDLCSRCAEKRQMEVVRC